MIDILHKYHEDGWLNKQVHPYLDLFVWDYSKTTQYESKWDDITLICRGLITDFNGKIIARPLKKFFNIEEHKPEDIPNEPFDVLEKEDGSLGIVFRYKNEVVVSTRGSFISKQAKRAKELLIKYDLESKIFSGYTYLFEIIYPENRIVVDYNGQEKMVLLAVIETETNKEIFIHTDYYQNNFNVVKRYDGLNDISLLKKTIDDNREGYVLKFKNGFTCKVKGDEYIRLHRIVTGITARDIWYNLKNNIPFDEILERVPDEFYNWVKETKKELQDKFDNIKKEVEDDFYQIINKKEFALKVKDNKNKHFLFSRLHSFSTRHEEAIWDSIYPEHIRPFEKNNNDE